VSGKLQEIIAKKHLEVTKLLLHLYQDGQIENLPTTVTSASPAGLPPKQMTRFASSVMQIWGIDSFKGRKF